MHITPAEADAPFCCRSFRVPQPDMRVSAGTRKDFPLSTNPHEDRAFLTQDDNAFLTKAEILKWEEGRTFHTDWAANHFFNWAILLKDLRQKPVRILEIGSWEGRSALFFLNYLPLSRIVCIDPFEGNVEHHIDPYFADLARKSEAQLDAISRRSRIASRRSRAARPTSCPISALPAAGSISPISTAATGRRMSIAMRP